MGNQIFVGMEDGKTSPAWIEKIEPFAQKVMQKCGWDGEITIKEQDGKLVWTCPQCGNQDQNTMNVARRTCGYIGTQFWNQGRTQEIKDRVLHL